MKNKNKLMTRVVLFVVLTVMLVSLTGVFTAFAAEDAASTTAPQTTSVDSAANTSTGEADEGTPAAEEDDTLKTDATDAEKAEDTAEGDKEDTSTDSGDKTDEETKEDEQKYKVNITTNVLTFDFLGKYFGYVLKFLYSLVSDYGIALLVFAILIKVVLFPLGIKQQKNSVKQASLKPKEQAIRNKYAGRTDKPTQQKMQQEIMDLYQKENFNPMGGCLPLLFQLPVIFALVQVVYNPLRHIAGLSLEQVRSIGEVLIKNGKIQENIIRDISMINAIKENFSLVSGIDGVSDKLKTVADVPNITFFGIDLSQTPMSAGGWLWAIPVLTFVIMFLSMKLTRKLTYQPQQAGDAGLSMKIMDFTMPAFSTYIAISFPAILGVYWIFQNMLGVLQQLILKKMYPIPEFTDEDYAAAEREYNGKAKKKKKTSPGGGGARNPNVRSLHHIDDDDDDTPALTEAQNQNGKKSKQKNETAASGMIDSAPLKEDVPPPSDTDDKGSAK